MRMPCEKQTTKKASSRKRECILDGARQAEARRAKSTIVRLQAASVGSLRPQPHAGGARLVTLFDHHAYMTRRARKRKVGSTPPVKMVFPGQGATHSFFNES